MLHFRVYFIFYLKKNFYCYIINSYNTFTDYSYKMTGMKKIIFLRFLFVLCAFLCIYRLFIYNDGSIMLDERIQFILVILTAVFSYLAVKANNIDNLKSSMKYIFLLLFSTIAFGLLFFTLFEKTGNYTLIFILLVLVYIAAVIVSYIKEKKKIYYFLLYMLLFWFILPLAGILIFVSILIFHHGNGQIIAEFLLFILEMTVFVPVIFMVVYKKYKLSLDYENILLKKDAKKVSRFGLIFFACILVVNLLFSFIIYQ